MSCDYGKWHPALVAARAAYEEAKKIGVNVEAARLQIAVALDIHNRSLGPWIKVSDFWYERRGLRNRGDVRLDFGPYGATLRYRSATRELLVSQDIHAKFDGEPTTAELLLVFEWADEILKQNNYVLR